MSELATRLSGSSDLYEQSGRRPYASINFITAHDGFTLADLVSYNDKHNEANGEDNRDGENHNLSWNCGVEGPTDDRRVLRSARAPAAQPDGDADASVGVPMISGGDELGRTQKGNNNAYCQDNEISWTHWDLTPDAARLPEFVAPADPDLARTTRCCGGASSSRAGASAARTSSTSPGSTPSGREMTDDTWNSPDVRCLGVRLNGDAIDEVDERGERIVGDTLVMLLNAGGDAIPFVLPATTAAERWETLLDTADPWQAPRTLRGRERYQLQSRSMAVLRLEGSKRRCRTGDRWGCDSESGVGSRRRQSPSGSRESTPAVF